MIVESERHMLCDRCKKEISFTNHAIFKAQRPIIKGTLLRRDDKHTREGQQFPLVGFDLCTECADDFENWVIAGRTPRP